MEMEIIMKEIMKKAGYVLLGALLTIIVVLLTREIKSNQDSTVAEVTEAEIVDIPIGTEETGAINFDAEAEERLAALTQEQATTTVEEEKTVSANSIEAAKVKWKIDYPMVNSEKTLEENQNIRSSYEETLATNTFDKKVIENSTIDFSDVKIAILGDSIMAGANLSEEEQKEYSIPAQLQKILGTKEIYNFAIGGSTVSRVSDAYPMVDRWQDIPYDIDILIVMGGTNDALFENKWDFGELDYDHRMKEATFCGDLDEMLGGMQYVYRDHNEKNYVKFICVNPPSTILNDGVYNTDPGNMVHQSSFAEAINQIGPEYGFEVIDLYNNNLFNTHDEQLKKAFMPDGVHCNVEGYQMMAEHFASQIIQRINQ